MVICGKKQKHCLPEELEAGDCWIAVSLAQLSGLILCGRIGKHTDELAQELVSSTEGKTNCSEWHTDGWEGYGRVLSEEVDHFISKVLTQRKRAYQRYSTAANWTLASTTKQIWQAVAAESGNFETCPELFQLDLAAFLPGNGGCTESRSR